MTQPLSTSELAQLPPDVYRRLQDAISQRLLTSVLPMLRTYVGREVTEADLALVAETLFPAVERARSDSARIASDFYQSQRRAHLTLVEPIAATNQAPDYELANLRKGLRSTLRPGLKLLSASEPASTLVRHAEQAGRDKIVGLSLVDDECEGWARRARGSRTCAFCTMLISRGPVYSSEKAATVRKNGSKAFHDRCDCQAVPVFDRSDFPGRQQWLDASDLWAESTRGLSGKNALAAFRKAHALDGRDAVQIAA